jgi:type-F conjugative transfer system pilin assembly protein TrbC
MRKYLAIAILIAISSPLFAEEVDTTKREVYITLPNVCHQIEKTEDNRVYLKSPEDPCIQVTSKKKIVLDEKYDTVEIYIDGEYSHDEKVMEGFDMNNVRDYLKRTDEYKKEIENSDFYRNEGWKHNEEAEKESKKTYEIYQSDEFQRKMKEETEKLKSGMFAKYSKRAREYYEDRHSGGTGEIAKGNKIYVMISRSVPLQTLRNYVKSIVSMNLNATMVMRGFVGGAGKIMPTVEFIMDVIKKDPSCEWSITHPCETYDTGITIDPTLFRVYGIEEVPAIVVARGIPVGNATPIEAYVITGDVSIEYAVEKVESKKKE